MFVTMFPMTMFMFMLIMIMLVSMTDVMIMKVLVMLVIVVVVMKMLIMLVIVIVVMLIYRFLHRHPPEAGISCRIIVLPGSDEKRVQKHSVHAPALPAHQVRGQPVPVHDVFVAAGQGVAQPLVPARSNTKEVSVYHVDRVPRNPPPLFKLLDQAAHRAFLQM
jgi:hypothetical protein